MVSGSHYLLGMLELYKEGKIRATQEVAYGPIEIELEAAAEEQEAACKNPKSC